MDVWDVKTRPYQAQVGEGGGGGRGGQAIADMDPCEQNQPVLGGRVPLPSLSSSPLLSLSTSFPLVILI